MSERVLIVNCPAMSPAVFERFVESNQFMKKFAANAQFRPMKPVFPAVTMPMQASLLTGAYPSEHGCISNSRLDRKTLNFDSWEQSALLLDKKPFWQRPEYSDRKVATVCWQFSYFNGADFVISPAPVHDRTGSTISSLYTHPEELSEILVGEFGDFPLKHYWGPFAGPQSTEWIFRATSFLILDYSPDIVFSYFPQLDFTFQRLKHSSNKIADDLSKLGVFLERMITFATRKKYKIVLMSEYGITEVDLAVPINLHLRKLGHLKVRTSTGFDIIDRYLSTAWALVDHQVASVFVKDESKIEQVADDLRKIDGVAEVINRDGQKKLKINHPNCSELVVIAEPNAWFNYHYWIDNAKMPSYARTVDIHSKPGYDPLELFFNRSTMTIETSNVALVRGSHGRLTEDNNNGGLFATNADVLKEDEDVLEAVQFPELIGRIVL